LEWDCCLRFIFDSVSAIALVVAERPKETTIPACFCCAKAIAKECFHHQCSKCKRGQQISNEFSSNHMICLLKLIWIDISGAWRMQMHNLQFAKSRVSQ
jgi:hypothetical protein